MYESQGGVWLPLKFSIGSQTIIFAQNQLRVKGIFTSLPGAPKAHWCSLLIENILVTRSLCLRVVTEKPGYCLFVCLFVFKNQVFNQIVPHYFRNHSANSILNSFSKKIWECKKKKKKNTPTKSTNFCLWRPLAVIISIYTPFSGKNLQLKPCGSPHLVTP